MIASQEEMIENQLQARDIKDPRVLNAMRKVDRRWFVPEEIEHRAYEDNPLPIGKEQTISQPYIVAYMTQSLQLNSSDKVLEIGTGCGYNAAVMAQIAQEVYSLEIIEWLADLAQKNLNKAGIENVQAKHEDGYAGWPEAVPFDAIVLTAAAPSIPNNLKNQLKVGGKILAPVGRKGQELIMLTKRNENTFEEDHLIPVRFVPMTGEVQSD